MNRADWLRLSPLLDELIELDAPARETFLAGLATDMAIALRKLLQRELANTVPAHRLLSQPAFSAALDGALGVAAEDDSDAAALGQSFGPWRVSRKLGEGGMGEVWLASRADALYEGEAAIKLLRNTGDATRLTARFSRERQALARLAHPGIARLLDAGVAKEQPYLVLEYVQGLPLAEYAHSKARTVVQRVRLALAIGRAVEYAHGRLIVHRDLKPSNVLVTAEGEVKLLDFGIASLIDEPGNEHTALTQLYGRGLTLDYAAPEQITGEHTGVGVDVFSLGVMLFELLTGTKPFKAAKAGRAAHEHAVLHQPAQKLSQAARTPLPAGTGAGSRPLDAARISGSLDAVLDKALQKSPEDRYPTMAAFVADLERWLEHRPVLAAQRDWQRDTALWLRRNRLAAGLSAAVIVSLAVGLSAALWQSRQAQKAATRAELQALRATAVSRFMSDLFRAADPEQTKGAALTAIEVLDAGAERLLKAGDEDAEIRAELAGALGETYASLTRPDKGIPVLKAAVDSATEAYGPRDTRTAHLQLILAKAESQNEQYPEAAARYAAAIPILEAAGETHSETMILARGYWSYCLAKAGQLEQADALQVETRARAVSAHGAQSWAYVDAVNSAATIATIRSDWMKARELLSSIEPLTLNPPEGYRQDALTMRFNLANTLARTGALNEALTRQEAIVKDYTELITAEGNQTLIARWFLADTYKRVGQFKACADQYTALAEARTRISGPEHPLTVDVVSKVAMCRRLTGELDLSREYAARATAALNPSDEPPQRTTLRVVSTLAALVDDTGDLAALEPMLARIRHLITALKLQGRDDRIYEAMLGAHLHLLQGDKTAALAGYETARSEAAVSMQNLHPEAYYAYLLVLAGKPSEASAQLAKVREMAAKRYQPDFQLFAALDYVESLIPGTASATTAGRAAVLKRLAAAYPVPVKLPLSPLWFGLG